MTRVVLGHSYVFGATGTHVTRRVVLQLPDDVFQGSDAEGATRRWQVLLVVVFLVIVQVVRVVAVLPQVGVGVATAVGQFADRFVVQDVAAPGRHCRRIPVARRLLDDLHYVLAIAVQAVQRALDVRYRTGPSYS